MNHSFDIGMAEKYGIEEAVIINNLDYWLSHNRANKANYHDGKYWTFNSARAFADLFPYMSAAKIRRVLIKLEEAGVIETGNYNKVGYDRTKWYTFTLEFCKMSKSILHFCKMEVTELNNGFDENVTPIPDINPDNKPTEEVQDEPYTKQIEQICSSFTEITGKRCNHKAKGNINIILPRLKEGYTVEDFKKVIEVKNAEWKDSSEMKAFIRPGTLFASSHIENYLNQWDPIETEEQIHDQEEEDAADAWRDQLFEDAI